MDIPFAIRTPEIGLGATKPAAIVRESRRAAAVR